MNSMHLIRSLEADGYGWEDIAVKMLGWGYIRREDFPAVRKYVLSVIPAGRKIAT